MVRSEFDLLVVGGGINGCGIAADAAGRGLTVLLAEMGDLAQGTSSASSKLIHGGLRYLENYDFRLVREALAEREVLLAKAPHIIWPLQFVLPHVPGLRHPWMIRAGLFLYDHLSKRRAIPSSSSIDFGHDAAGRPFRSDLKRGFAYWDCWVDDARLVVLNAQAAAIRGAEILTRTKVTNISIDGHFWRARLEAGNDGRTVRARAVVNAAGPWADELSGLIDGGALNRPRLRLVKGSHIVVPRIDGAADAYLLQSGDGRVVFALPYEHRFTIIGTTEVPYTGDPSKVAPSVDEENYLLELANQFFKSPIGSSDIKWRYSGVRPLYDDHSDSPSAVTRDYRIELSTGQGRPPLITVLGGKITTYRRLAEEVLDRLTPYLAKVGPAWTATTPLPGGNLPSGNFDGFVTELSRRHEQFEPDFLRRLARRHGRATDVVLGDARTQTDLGQNFGASLTEREIIYLRDHEWARTADDILWRRTKVGLHLPEAAHQRTADAIDRIIRD